MNMKSLLALLAALLLIWALPVQAMAGDSEAPAPENGNAGTDVSEALTPEPVTLKPAGRQSNTATKSLIRRAAARSRSALTTCICWQS